MFLKDLENGYSSKEIIFRNGCSYSTFTKVEDLNKQLNKKLEFVWVPKRNKTKESERVWKIS